MSTYLDCVVFLGCGMTFRSPYANKEFLRPGKLRRGLMSVITSVSVPSIITFAVLTCFNETWHEHHVSWRHST